QALPPPAHPYWRVLVHRVTHHISSDPRHHVMAAGPEHGTHFVLGQIRALHPHTVWVHLPHRAGLDAVEQGHLLITAVNKAFGRRLPPHGLSLDKALAALRLYARPKHTTNLLISNAQAGCAFLEAALKQNPQVLKVTAACHAWEDREGVVTVPAEDLLLSEEEALRWPGTGVPEEVARAAWRDSGGVLVPFLLACSEAAEVPPPLMPGADKPEFLPGQEVTVPPELLFEALVLQERWASALELALAMLPERAGEVLEQAGHAYHQLAQHQRLYTLIGELPGEA